MTIKFKQLMQKIDPAIIPVAPIHGAHSRKRKMIEPILIPVAPVHGTHSVKHIVREGVFHDDHYLDHDEYEHFDHDEHLLHPHNKHLGTTPTEVHKKLDMPKEKFDKHPGSKNIRAYTDWSKNINDNLLAVKKRKGKLGLLIKTTPQVTNFIKSRRRSNTTKTLLGSIEH